MITDATILLLASIVTGLCIGAGIITVGIVKFRLFSHWQVTTNERQSVYDLKWYDLNNPAGVKFFLLDAFCLVLGGIVLALAILPVSFFALECPPDHPRKTCWQTNYNVFVGFIGTMAVAVLSAFFTAYHKSMHGFRKLFNIENWKEDANEAIRRSYKPRRKER